MSYSIDVAAAAAKIGPHTRLTDLEYSVGLSALCGAEVWLKPEHLQHTGSFKWRGALNRLLTLTPAELEKGVITASNGNHGLAVCRAGALVGVRPRVSLCFGVPAEKVEMRPDSSGPIMASPPSRS
ncbi:MAG: pyridoxal-phosphate dependent enzyme, partial [Acidobacteria bacterium]|nr:pyridoxal-phosphate dependent enzyme [Acidobacteriota bacterium]